MICLRCAFPTETITEDGQEFVCCTNDGGVDSGGCGLWMKLEEYVLLRDEPKSSDIQTVQLTLF